MAKRPKQVTPAANDTNDTKQKAPRISVEPQFLKPALPATGGDVPVLVRFTGTLDEDKGNRTPLDVALVFDRSGSMRGEPMEAALQGAHDAIDLLGVGDRITIVTFDNQVQLVAPLTTIEEDRDALHAAVDEIVVRGSTALHAGWVEGAQALADALDPNRFARVLLLTDGHANVGETDPTVIAQDVAQLRAHGITTSTIGLGRRFSEDLLTAMSEAGGGRFAFAEVASEVQAVMAAELIGIDATVARNVKVRTLDGGDHVDLIDVLNDLPVEGDATVLPDLIADMPVDLVGTLRVAAGEPEDALHVGDLDLTWTGRDGVDHTLTVPVHADLVDAEVYDAMEENPEVAATHAALRAGRRRKVAVAALDQGDMAAVKAELDAIDYLLQGAPDTAAIQRERRAADRIRDAVQRGDRMLARKRMRFEDERTRESFRYEEFRGSRYYGEKEAALRERRALREARERQAGARSKNGHADTEPGDDPTRQEALASLTVDRADGSTAEIRLVMGDVTLAAVDAIVNPTNPGLHGTGRSVDGAVHRRGGAALTRECRDIGRAEVGQTVVTHGHDLRARYVLHTVSPKFDGTERAFRHLASCYRTSIDLARQMRLQHLAYPAIGVGSNRVPPFQAAQVALTVLRQALTDPAAPSRIDLVVYDVAARSAYERAFSTLPPSAGNGGAARAHPR